MLTSGLTNAPLTKTLFIYTIAASIALSILDVKHVAVIHVSPHFWPYAQFWRALAWQIAGFANSTEALFAAMLVYHLRVVERAWGKRKMAVSVSTLHEDTARYKQCQVCVRTLANLSRLSSLPPSPTPPSSHPSS